MQMRFVNELILEVELFFNIPSRSLFFFFILSRGVICIYIYIYVLIILLICARRICFNTLYLLEHEVKLLPSPTNYYCFDMSQ